jgi:hypothetical protein
VKSSASFSSFNYLLFFLRPSSNCLRLLPCLVVPSICFNKAKACSGNKLFSSPKLAGMALGPPSLLFTGGKAAGVTLPTHPHLALRIRTRDITLLPCVPARRVQAQLYLTFLLTC